MIKWVWAKTKKFPHIVTIDNKNLKIIAFFTKIATIIKKILQIDKINNRVNKY